MKSRRSGIFISYRRADSAGQAGRLFDHLNSQFGSVFLDVDSIKAGSNFELAIRETLTSCGVVILLIGKRWLERDHGMPPFGDDRDVITQEIRTALDLGVPLLPVLVDGVAMPSETALPADFQALAKLNAIELRHASFDRDMAALAECLTEILGGVKPNIFEKLVGKVYGPMLGGSYGRLRHAFVWFAVGGAALGVLELAIALVQATRWGIEGLRSESLFDPEVSHASAVATWSLGGLIFGLLGRRSVKWWRWSNLAIVISLICLVVCVALVIVYITHVPGGHATDLFDRKVQRIVPQ
ncbi:MAG TPA: toll/interleukin-1 receptor domain-containing protein [Candidatus Udaeobacter sp.]|jgi:hypothetical protein|nr:toll/interleukin-1 receptor domain-containing protein [Candidatus Udaeobacter sp.]